MFSSSILQYAHRGVSTMVVSAWQMGIFVSFHS